MPKRFCPVKAREWCQCLGGQLYGSLDHRVLWGADGNIPSRIQDRGPDSAAGWLHRGPAKSTLRDPWGSGKKQPGITTEIDALARGGRLPFLDAAGAVIRWKGWRR